MKVQAMFLDCDGLIFDTLRTHVIYLNHRWGVSSTEADYIGNPHIHEVLNQYLRAQRSPEVTDAQVYEDLTVHFHASIAHHANVQPLEGVTDVLPQLAQKYELILVTARPRQARRVISHLLKTHNVDHLSHMHFVYDHLGNGIFADTSKREYMAGYEGDKVAFIDDSPNEIHKVQGIVPSYLFDPHHLHAGDTKITNRLHSWQEIGSIFL